MRSTAAGETVYGELVHGRNRGGRGSMPDRRGGLWPAAPDVGVISCSRGRLAVASRHDTAACRFGVTGRGRWRSTCPGMAPPGSVGIGQGPGSACRDRATCCRPRQQGRARRGHHPRQGRASLGVRTAKCAHTGAFGGRSQVTAIQWAAKPERRRSQQSGSQPGPPAAGTNGCRPCR